MKIVLSSLVFLMSLHASASQNCKGAYEKAFAETGAALKDAYGNAGALGTLGAMTSTVGTIATGVGGPVSTTVIAAGVGGAMTVGGTANYLVKKNQHKRIADAVTLINESEIGMGLLLNRVAQKVNKDPEQVATLVKLYASNGALCTTSELLGVAEISELISLSK